MSDNRKMDVNELIEQNAGNSSDIMETLADIDCDIEQMEKIYEALDSNDGDVNLNLDDTETYDTNEDVEKILQQEGLATDDPVRMYLKEIGKIPLLDSDREMYLAEQIHLGNKAAKDELVEANLRLVVSIAKRHVGK